MRCIITQGLGENGPDHAGVGSVYSPCGHRPLGDCKKLTVCLVDRGWQALFAQEMAVYAPV